MNKTTLTIFPRIYIILFLVLLAISFEGQATQPQNSKPSELESSADSRLPDAVIQELQKIDSSLARLETMQRNQREMIDTINVPHYKTLPFWVAVFGVLLGIMASAVISYILANQQIKRGSQDLNTAKQQLETQIAKISSTSDDLGKQIKDGYQQRQALNTQLSQQILNIDEVTRHRHILNGFPDIFRKAEEMLRHCQNTFYMLSFTANFGYIHTFNQVICAEVEKDGHGTLPGRVIEFKHGIAEKAENSGVDFKLVFLSTEGDLFDSEFIRPIAEKNMDGAYSDEIRQKIATLNREAIELIHKALISAGKEPDECLIPASSIPLQIFVADIGRVGHEGSKSDRQKACLVFFVGTQNLEVSIRERGIYTEHPALVELFIDVFDGIYRKRLEPSMAS